MSKKTIFIVIEGGDGVGKTTFISSLKEKLENDGLKVGLTKSLLSDTIIGKATREWINTPNEVCNNLQIGLQFSSALVEANNRLEKTLESGEYDVVISDRWILSTYVYAPNENVFADIPDYNFVHNSLIVDMLGIVDQSIVEPDIMYVLTCSPETAISRIKARDGIIDGDVFTNEDMVREYIDRYMSYLAITDDMDDVTIINDNDSIIDYDFILEHIKNKCKG